MVKRGYTEITGYDRSKGGLTKAARAYGGKRKMSAFSRYKKRANAKIGGFLGIELKYYDTALVTTALTAPSDCAGGEVDPETVLTISAPAQGDGETNRDGKQILVKSAYVTGNIHRPINSDEGDAHTEGPVYIALVMDMQTNKAQLNSEDVFTNPSGGSSTAAQPLRDLQYTSRFKVLDSCVVMPSVRYVVQDGAATGSISGEIVPFKLSWNGEMPVNFTGTAAGVASVTDNSLHVIAYAAATSSGPQINYNARVRFVG